MGYQCSLQLHEPAQLAIYIFVMKKALRVKKINRTKLRTNIVWNNYDCNK